ncbi:FecR family protein [Carboxylicivirga taeanensis]|uniref:FecR family protein n=1 Tax=Carboxylicivirga taeanensis TaxID=1416875 RepID=UPI003F6E3930
MQHKAPIDKIIAELDSSISVNEKAELNEWRRQHPENDAFFKAFKYIWAHTGHANSQYMPKTEEALLQVTARIHRRQIIRTFSRIAAIVVIGLFIGTIIHRHYDQVDTEHITAQQQQTITLPDNTTVTLASGSQLSYPKPFTNRKVTLNGKAWFNVHHDASRPFTIKTAHGNTKVLGTKFTLSDSKEGDLHLFLDEGKVAFKPQNWLSKPLIVSPREMVSLQNNEYAISQQPDLNASTWATNILSFKNTPLSEVIQELQNHYQVDINLQSKAIGNLRFSGRISEDNVSNALEIIALTLNLKIIKDTNTLTLSL